MYQLSYNVYDRAGTLEGDSVYGVEDKLSGRLEADLRLTNVIYDVKFLRVPGGVDKYIRYLVSGDIVDENDNKVGHYVIRKV